MFKSSFQFKLILLFTALFGVLLYRAIHPHPAREPKPGALRHSESPPPVSPRQSGALLVPRAAALDVAN